MSNSSEDSITGSGSTEHLTMLVPELLYDISSKIVPGIILSLFYAGIYFGPDGVKSLIVGFLKMNTSVSDDTFIILIGSSWTFTLSTLLWSQYYLVDKVWKRFFRSSEGLVDGKENTIREIALKCDFIRLKNNAAGNRIAKLQSELQMSEVFFVGFCYGIPLTLWACCGSFGIGAQQGSGYGCTGWALVAAIGIFGSLLCHSRLSRKIEITISNHYELLSGVAG